MKGYPRAFLGWLLATLGSLFGTGLLLAPTTLAMRAKLEVSWRLSVALRNGCAIAHASLGLMVLLFLGAIWGIHMRSGWRRRRHYVSGIGVVTLLAALAATALVIYYASDEAVNSAASVAHLAIGMGVCLLFVWHWLRGRSARTPGSL